ncbi:MAG TPA: hypothetical protein VF103_08295, partial [Polyangiaceae bacterium]
MSVIAHLVDAIDSFRRVPQKATSSRRWTAWTLSLVACLATCLVSLDAHAWKPYTHVKLADQAKDEAVATIENGVGGFRIRGEFYPLRQDVFEAIRDFPTFFDGGVIGPDGMPDITFGQGQIHPKRSGMWLARLLETAFKRQGSVGTEQAKQELAFTYGFISHGAGDMWGHSLVNDFAQGVFPEFTDIFKELLGQNPGGRPFAGVSNALRHMIVEQYVGDATVGFDGNPNFTSVNGDL